MMHIKYLLDLVEIVILVVIGGLLLVERAHLKSYFANSIDKGTGSDFYMLMVAFAVFLCVAVFVVIRTKEWSKNRSRLTPANDVITLKPLFRPLSVFVCLFVYAALMPLAGYGLASLVFFVLFSRLDTKNLKLNVAHGFLLAIGFYITFVSLFGVSLPKVFFDF